MVDIKRERDYTHIIQRMNQSVLFSLDWHGTWLKLVDSISKFIGHTSAIILKLESSTRSSYFFVNV